MNWGRPPRRRPQKKEAPAVLPRSSVAVMAAGSLVCAFFFCAAVTGSPTMPEYPPQKAAAAWEAFGREHTTLTAVLGIDEYFPEEAVYAGAFGKPQKRWNFADYMRDVLRSFVLGSGA